MKSAWVYSKKSLPPSYLKSLYYHDIFSYPMTVEDLQRWQAGPMVKIKKAPEIAARGKYFFVKGKGQSVILRNMRSRTSRRKTILAKKASKIISKIPSITFVGITGALAMENADANGDIDFLIITTPGTLWSSRLLVYLILSLKKVKVRRPGGDEQDRLCLNIWMSESDLVWRQRNVFTAHEIAQIIPLVNKQNIYEVFLLKNKWILGYWPKAVRIKGRERVKEKAENPVCIQLLTRFVLKVLDPVAYRFQYLYMKGKITREKVSKKRAVFHPQDWSRIVTGRGF